MDSSDTHVGTSVASTGRKRRKQRIPVRNTQAEDFLDEHMTPIYSSKDQIEDEDGESPLPERGHMMDNAVIGSDDVYEINGGFL